jgi:hypothetical protein
MRSLSFERASTVVGVGNADESKFSICGDPKMSDLSFGGAGCSDGSKIAV